MRQQGDSKHGGRSKAAPELLNFHFSTSPPPSSSTASHRRQQYSSYTYNHHRSSSRNQGSRQQQQQLLLQQQQKQQQYRRSKEDRASARRKASAQNFYLHSSPDHAFVLTRRASSKQQLQQQQQQQHQYSFNGPDSPVSWESVRMVKYLSSSSGTATEERCPICLDDFCCARITKCGHNFCLTCAIRCVHSYMMSNDNNPYSTERIAAKCPCCAIPMHLEDLRPVLLITTLPPALNQQMKFIKLHRVKGCPAPFLPSNSCLKHSSPHAAPCQTDPDAAFCRFNYVDPVVYQSHLTHNLNELQQQQQQLSDKSHYSMNTSTQDAFFLQLAVERVQRELQAAIAEVDEEMLLMERFQNPAAGFYQEHPRHLLASSSSSSSSQVMVSAIAADADADEKSQQQQHAADVKDAALPKSIKTAWTAGQDEHPIEAASSPPTPSSETMTTPHVTITTTRYRGESFGSEPSLPSRADDSLASLSCDLEPSSPGRLSSPRNKKNKTPLIASMYLDKDESAFYQTEDGSLCFLSGFNMNTLRTEFSSTVPDEESTWLSQTTTKMTQQQQQQSRRHRITPLPDFVEGRVVEIERTHLTPDLRSRLRFLSHLPIYSDICFVEIGLGHLLSQDTKRVYKKEFQKRKQARQNRISAERKADARAKREEEARINELKARIQRIDPEDQFFHSVPVPEMVETGDDFGPALSTSPMSQSAAMLNPAATTTTTSRTSSFSFSQITREGGVFPALQTTNDFPSLGGSSPSPPVPTRSTTTTTTTKWGPSRSVAKEVDSLTTQAAPPPPTGKKKNKGKKIVLFSTGSHRGTNY